MPHERNAADPPPVARSRRGFTLLASTLLWCLLFAWQRQEQRADESQHRQALVESGNARIAMIEATLRTVGRRRREQGDYLNTVLGEVVRVASVRGAWLTERSGKRLGARGEERELPDPRTFDGELWTPADVLVGRTIDTTLRPMEFAGQSRGRPIEDRPVFLFLAIDRSSMDAELRAAWTQRTIALAIAAAALLASYLVVLQRARTRALNLRLRLADSRSKHLKETNLLAAGLAHETKNPLSVIRGLAAHLCEPNSELLPCAAGQRMLEQADRIAARVNELLRFARPQEPKLEPVALDVLFADLSTLLEPDLAEHQATLAIEPLPGAILADPELIRQILLNLLVNAAQALQDGGHVTLAARTSDDGLLRLDVRDDGEGIPGPAIDRVFEPYYTRKSGGTGLGLAIVWRLVEAHGWTVRVSSGPGSGTTFTIEGIQRANAPHEMER